MSLHCGFVFPNHNFKLVFMDTIGYISDNVFYRINMNNGQTQIYHHQKGRTYQALTTNYKKGIVVLADYCQNPTLYFEYLHQKQLSFSIQNFCTLEINQIQISLDSKYLLVACGVPDNKIILIDIQKKSLVKGQKSAIPLHQKGKQPIKIDFNPNNSKIFAVMYPQSIQIYEISQRFQISKSGQIQQCLIINSKHTIQMQFNQHFQTFIWDQINDLYISNGRNIIIYSIDTCKQIINYEIQNQQSGGNQSIVINMILTPKHLIIFYRNGRIEWLIKYYPDLMQQQLISIRPFYLDKYYDLGQHINWAIYNHLFSKIYVSLSNGYFATLTKTADAKQADEEQQQKKQQSKHDLAMIDKHLDLQVIKMGPYHCSAIVFAHQISNSSACLSISKDGKLIFWSLKRKKAIIFFDFKQQIICADINRYENVITIGTKSGIIQFYSISDPQNIYLFKQFKLTINQQLDSIKFSTNSQEAAVLIKSQKRIFYILTHLSMEFQVLGYINIIHHINSICWNSFPKTQHKPRFEYLLVNIGYGILMVNGPTAVPTKKRGKQLQLECQVYALRTDLQQQLACVLPNGQLLTTGQDKLLKKYKQPQDILTKIDFKSKVPIPAPNQQIIAHDLQTTYLSVGKRYFITGGVDGNLHIRTYDNFNQFKTIKAYGWKNKNLSIVLSSEIDGIFYSCGNDGSIYIWNISNNTINQSDLLKKQTVKYQKIQQAGKKIKYYQQIIQQQYLQKMKDIINKKKKTQFQKLQKIKKQLQQLLKQNQQHDQLQKLQRDQFAIDLQSRQKVAQAGKQKCLAIRQQSKRLILQKQVYTKKLKQITWDRMQVHLKAINGLKYNYIVYNYQIRKRSKDQLRKINIILDLRRIQKTQTRKKMGKQLIDPQFHKNKNVVNGGYMPTLILGNYQKKDQKKQQKGKKKKQQQVVQKQQPIQQVQTDQEWSLLYSSFQLFSTNSKRNQIIMMKNIIIKIKQIFNSQFNKLMQYRQNQNQIINDKNKRIIQICQQLKRPNQILISNKNILQNPQIILQVKPQDILFKRYLSKQQRDKLQKQRLKQQQRLRKLAQDDSSQRALQKMMGGTLQEKKTSALQVIVQKQKWMDKPLQQMTQQEKLKVKQYQIKKQKAQQQKQRIIKKLQAQLRKLKLQIDDIMEKYDQKLFMLMKRRIQYDYRIQQQQLYCAKLALTMISVQDQAIKRNILEQRVKTHQNIIYKLDNQKNNLQGHDQQFVRLRDQKKLALDTKKYGDIQSKIRTIEKSVFEDYGQNLKKKRQMEQKLLQRDPIAKYQLINLDPMKQIQSRNLSTLKSQQFNFFLSQIKVLQQTFDIPQASLLQILQNRFNIKKQQAQLDKKVKNLKDSILEIDKEIENQKNYLKQDQTQIQQILAYLLKSKSDLEIQCRIKQGQVQINNESPIPNLDDALLISKTEIDQKNQLIMQNANQKIKVMEKIKTCKISVTEQTLNLQRKQQMINQLSMMIKDIQMLKVKKQMQVALSKKDTKINDNELRSLKSRIQEVRKEGEKRITLFEKKIQQISKQIEGIQKQNKQLEVQKYNLENTVKQRQKIKDMMCGENGQGNQEAAEKFDQIAINRKLFDKAKQQTEQIELLRQELSKLKAKTFANFSNVQR